VIKHSRRVVLLDAANNSVFREIGKPRNCAQLYSSRRHYLLKLCRSDAAPCSVITSGCSCCCFGGGERREQQQLCTVQRLYRFVPAYTQHQSAILLYDQPGRSTDNTGSRQHSIMAPTYPVTVLPSQTSFPLSGDVMALFQDSVCSLWAHICLCNLWVK